MSAFKLLTRPNQSRVGNDSLYPLKIINRIRLEDSIQKLPIYRCSNLMNDITFCQLVGVFRPYRESGLWNVCQVRRHSSANSRYYEPSASLNLTGPGYGPTRPDSGHFRQTINSNYFLSLSIEGRSSAAS